MAALPSYTSRERVPCYAGPMTGDAGEIEARIVDEPCLDPEGIRLALVVGETSVTVWFHDRTSDGAARGATTLAMRSALKMAREYRRRHKDAFERLFQELDARHR
jgi:hypothetical protein